MAAILRFLALAASLLAAAPCIGAETRAFTDSAGRVVEVPATIERVYAAGPPASVFVYALTPDKLIGWTRALKDDERVSCRRAMRIFPNSDGLPAAATRRTSKSCSSKSPT
ncbi:MAG: hypothetical protein ACR2FI_08525 [Burkholderiales bacterium]|nr:hypothetical protein [Pseudomonadota bacterium]